MAYTWTTHHEGTVNGRTVEVKTYSDGGYRISTTQSKDDLGSVSSDGSSTLIMTPTSKGRKIDIDGETVDEVCKQLVDEDFTEEEIKEIIGHFPS